MTKLLAIVGVLIVILAGIFFVRQTINKPIYQPEPQSSAPQETINPNSPGITIYATPAPAAKEYTLFEVAAHNNKQSCWSAINGSVYDLSDWISEHPGGEAAILSICGKDGSSAFNAQHGGQSRPERELASFQIGVLKK